MRREIDVARFRPDLAATFAPFDPFPDETHDLSDSERTLEELLVYLSGGWFQEHADVVPRNPEWVYGDEPRPYGWIDEEAYRALLSSRLGSGASTWV